MSKKIELSAELLNANFKELYEKGEYNYFDIYEKYMEITNQHISFGYFRQKLLSCIKWDTVKARKNRSILHREKVLKEMELYKQSYLAGKIKVEVLIKKVGGASFVRPIIKNWGAKHKKKNVQNDSDSKIIKSDYHPLDNFIEKTFTQYNKISYNPWR